jgi:poly(3-hydroxybutyrate) depolymerase
VCQPCVAVLAAVAVMAQAANPAQPRSMTLMAGPIDTRVNPTKVNELANKRSIEWFERNADGDGAAALSGRVSPGLSGLRAARRLHEHEHRAAREGASRALREPRQRRGREGGGDQGLLRRIFRRARSHRRVLSRDRAAHLPGIRAAARQARMARRAIDPSAIRRTMLLTVEGERDDICAVGQTVAAHDLCSKLRPYLKRHHMQAGVGHYGVFSGKRWENQIYPIVKNVILSSDCIR